MRLFPISRNAPSFSLVVPTTTALFRMVAPVLFRWIVVGAILLAPGLIYVATQTQTNTQDVHTWLPNGTVERDRYDQFLSLFGHDDDILISWSGCTMDDQRLADLTNRLQSHTGEGGRFRGVINGKIVLEHLASAGLGLSDAALRRRLSNVFLGDDGETSGIIIQLSDTGRINRKACVHTLMDEVDSVIGLTRDEVRVGGSSYISSQIDKSTNHSLLLSIPAILLSVSVSFFCLRSWRLTIITLSVAAFAALSSVSLVTILGFKINGLLVLMPILVLVLTLSGCVHLCSYYKTGMRSDPTQTPEQLAQSALSFGWRPSSMAMLTTSVGILMLATSHIEAVRHFGVFSALSIVIALGVLLTLFPALLGLWPASEKERAQIMDVEIPAKALAHKSREVPWRRLATPTLALIMLLGVGAFFGLGKIQTTLSPTKMFEPSSEVNRNYNWINQNWSSLESVEVLVKFPREQGTMLDQLKTVSQIHGSTQNIDNVCSAFSTANISPPVSWRRTAKATAKRRVLDGKLKEHKQSLIDRRLIAEDDTHRYWRIRLGICVANDRDYEGLLASIDSKASLCYQSLEQPPEVILTGIWPLSAAGRHQLFCDLANSFIMAFVIITPVVMLILRGFWVGLVAMIPNVFPALLFFGALGWLGWRVNIGTILTASVGMGIAVDDTLHFIEWYVRQRKKETSSTSAVAKTIKQCARPMLYTTLICSSGLIVFAFSQFVPPKQFAYAIVALLGIALVCDLILLPALIAGPIGFVFDRAAKHSHQKTDDTPTIIEIPISQVEGSCPTRRAA